MLFSHSVVSDSLRSQGLQHSWLLCPPRSPSLLKFMSIEWVMLSNHLILCQPLLLLSSIFQASVFSSEKTFSVLCIRWPKYYSFSFSMSPSNEYSVLISFKIDWFDLFSVQETLKPSPASQFQGISSSMLRILYGQTLTFIHGY